MSARAAAVHRRVEAKADLVRKLIRREATLLQTAVCFRELDEGWPEFPWDQFREAYAGNNDDERRCRLIIAFVDTAPMPIEEREKLVDELNAELQDLLRRNALPIQRGRERAAK